MWVATARRDRMLFMMAELWRVRASRTDWIHGRADPEAAHDGLSFLPAGGHFGGGPERRFPYWSDGRQSMTGGWAAPR